MQVRNAHTTSHTLLPAFACFIQQAQKSAVLHFEEIFGLIIIQELASSLFFFFFLQALSTSQSSTFLALISDSLPRKIFVKIICYN